MTGEDLDKANRWCQSEGYEWLCDKPNFIRDWRVWQRDHENIDPAIYFCNQGYDSPAIDIDVKVTIDTEWLLTEVEDGKQRWPGAALTYHDNIYYTDLTKDPEVEKWYGMVTIPCYADKVYHWERAWQGQVNVP